MLNESHWLQRVHSNGKIAKVLKGPNPDDYVASVTDARQGGVATEAVARFDNELGAKAEADKLAHPDCDGTCTAWAEVPRPSITADRAKGVLRVTSVWNHSHARPTRM